MSLQEYSLERLKTEVLDSGIDSTLPCNLTDDWLRVMQSHILALQAEDEIESDANLAFPLAAVLHTHTAKQIHTNEHDSVKAPINLSILSNELDVLVKLLTRGL